MGVPVNSTNQFEENARYSRKSWTMIIFANAASDSRAVEILQIKLIERANILESTIYRNAIKHNIYYQRIVA